MNHATDVVSAKDETLLNDVNYATQESTMREVEWPC